MSPRPSDEDFDPDQWVSALVNASAAVEPVATDAPNAVIHFKMGRAASAVVSFDAGRVIGGAEVGEATVTLPLTTEQLGDYCDGSQSMSRDYMRGDLKPVGPTGHFIALIDLFENPDFVSALNSDA